MEIAESDREVPSIQSDWRLFHLTDLHLEERSHAGKELQAFIKRIEADERALVVTGGDYGGLILPGDPRYGDGYMEGVPSARVPDYVKEQVVETFWPIRDKIIGFGIGNHERTLEQRWHRNIAAEAAFDLGIQHLYLGLRGWAVVRFMKGNRKLILKIYWHHGWGAGRSKSRKILQEERDLGASEADIQLVGHDHQPWINSWYQRRLRWNAKRRKFIEIQVPICFMNGGSWTYGQEPPDRKKVARKPSEIPQDSWEDSKNFRPEPPRTPVLHIHVDMGNARNEKRGCNGRPAGFDFTEEMYSPRFYTEDWE